MFMYVWFLLLIEIDIKLIIVWSFPFYSVLCEIIDIGVCEREELVMERTMIK